MNEQKSLLLEIAEAIDHRLQQRAPWDESASPVKRGPRWLRWLGRQMVPNIGTLLMVVVLLLTIPSLAAPLIAPSATSTSTISYQGRLADASGNPLTGKYNLEFRIYDVPTGGVPLWTEMWTGANAVDVSDGLFNVMLGSINNTLASSIENHDELYLGITVGTDSEMVPRVQLGSVPFLMMAQSLVGQVTTDQIADDAITKHKIAHQFGASNSEMLNFVPRDPTGWDYDDSSQGTYDIDLSGIVSSSAVGVKVLVSFKMAGGRRVWLYPKGKTDSWDRVGWYSWNDAEALSGRERQFTYDLFFGDYRQLTVYKDGASWGSNEVFKLAVIGWWEPAHQ